MQIRNITETRPWYREPWVWLIIALPMTAVIAGMITLYLAITTSDGLVVDDYYKRGKTINLELARDQAATRYQLAAQLHIDAQNGQVTVQLESRDNLRPAHLKMLLMHPTRAGHDQVVRLEPNGADAYSGAVSPVAAANWHVQLEADDWRLSGRTPLPQVAPLRLVSQDSPDSGSPANP